MTFSSADSELDWNAHTSMSLHGFWKVSQSSLLRYHWVRIKVFLCGVQDQVRLFVLVAVRLLVHRALSFCYDYAVDNAQPFYSEDVTNVGEQIVNPASLPAQSSAAVSIYSNFRFWNYHELGRFVLIFL